MSHSTPAAAAGPRCDAADLTLGYGRRVSPATGERAVLYALENTTARSCHLFGFPGVSFYDGRGHLMPQFRFQRDHSQYILISKPQLVVLEPHDRAYFEVAAYRCDARVGKDAVDIRIYPPGATTFLQGPVTPPRDRRDGSSAFTDCAPNPDDPGKLVSIGPVEPIQRAVFVK